MYVLTAKARSFFPLGFNAPVLRVLSVFFFFLSFVFTALRIFKGGEGVILLPLFVTFPRQLIYKGRYVIVGLLFFLSSFLSLRLLIVYTHLA